MSGDYVPFEFPLELEQDIFAFAFRQNRFDALNLLLVSKTVFGWIIPLLYEVVVIGAGSQIGEDQIKEYGHHVRHLHVQGSAGWAAYCPRAFDIALWLRPTPNEIEDILELPIIQLSTEIHIFFNRTPKMLAFCSRITHLDITTGSHWDPREIIPHFLALSHVAMFSNVDLHIIKTCLEVGRDLELKLMILLSWNSKHHATETETDPLYEEEREPGDEEHVIRVVLQRPYIEDWEEGAWGGVDMWAFADQVLDKRRIETSKSQTSIA
ncbi:hypothetical protein BDN72DRAFT_901597 [Pluteus cervinus]|uniref:Uncharacterized protein n=1 Tax=Pluteus cervinus TaxID=181527 RepID=A0ACD3AG78_9AGAR|nr:hypothetical protein BDN72DRAFT_901597 [Pluteus cervinus]